MGYKISYSWFQDVHGDFSYVCQNKVPNFFFFFLNSVPLFISFILFSWISRYHTQKRIEKSKKSLKKNNNNITGISCNTRDGNPSLWHTSSNWCWTRINMNINKFNGQETKPLASHQNLKCSSAMSMAHRNLSRWVLLYTFSRGIPYFLHLGTTVNSDFGYTYSIHI